MRTESEPSGGKPDYQGWVDWVFDQRKPTGTDRLVLLSIATFADWEGHCYPGLHKLGDMCCIGPRMVSASIGRLIEGQHLAIIERASSRKGPTYKILSGSR